MSKWRSKEKCPAPTHRRDGNGKWTMSCVEPCPLVRQMTKLDPKILDKLTDAISEQEGVDDDFDLRDYTITSKMLEQMLNVDIGDEIELPNDYEKKTKAELKAFLRSNYDDDEDFKGTKADLLERIENEQGGYHLPGVTFEMTRKIQNILKTLVKVPLGKPWCARTTGASQQESFDYMDGERHYQFKSSVPAGSKKLMKRHSRAWSSLSPDDKAHIPSASSVNVGARITKALGDIETADSGDDPRPLWNNLQKATQYANNRGTIVMQKLSPQGAKLLELERERNAVRRKVCVRRTSKRYTSRKSPPYEANDCKGKSRVGNDGLNYKSEKRNGKYRWVVHAGEYDLLPDPRSASARRTTPAATAPAKKKTAKKTAKKAATTPAKKTTAKKAATTPASTTPATKKTAKKAATAPAKKKTAKKAPTTPAATTPATKKTPKKAATAKKAATTPATKKTPKKAAAKPTPAGTNKKADSKKATTPKTPKKAAAKTTPAGTKKSPAKTSPTEHDESVIQPTDKIVEIVTHKRIGKGKTHYIVRWSRPYTQDGKTVDTTDETFAKLKRYETKKLITKPQFKQFAKKIEEYQAAHPKAKFID